MKKKVTVKGYRWYAWGMLGSGIEDLNIARKAAEHLGIENFDKYLEEDEAEGSVYVGEEAFNVMANKSDVKEGRYVIDVGCGDGGVVIIEGLEEKDWEDLKLWSEDVKKPEDVDLLGYYSEIDTGSADDVGGVMDTVARWLSLRGYEVKGKFYDCSAIV